MKENFDNITKVDKTGHEWSQICKECVKRLNLTQYIKDDSKEEGSGICGVKGCTNTADYYIDFPDNPNEKITLQ